MMTNMKPFFLIYIAVFVLVGVSCQQKRSHVCEISIDVSQDAEDSLSVYCYEPDYNRSRIIFTGKIVDGHLLLSDNNNTGVSRVAYFLCGEDTVAHYFVLEPGRVDIAIEKERIRIQGSRSNYDLFCFRNSIKRIDYERKRIKDSYLKDVRDSVLNEAVEMAAFTRDSVLADSVQHLLVKRIGRGDAVSRIIKEQYSSRLTQASWEKIK